MAQKPIGYYGTFTPTGVDPTVARRMEQLAGVGEQVAGLAVGFGKAKAAADAPEKALADVAKAREEGTGIKKKSPFAWGGEVYNRAAEMAYESGLKIDLNKAMNQAAIDYPDDLIAYNNAVTSSKDGLLSNASETIKFSVDNYFRQNNIKYSTQINKNAKIKTDEFLLGEYTAGLQLAQDNISNLAFNGNIEELNNALESFELLLEDSQDFMSPSQLAIEKEKIADLVAIQTELGKIDKVINDPDSNSETKLIEAKTLYATLLDTPTPELNATQRATILDSLRGNIGTLDSEIKSEKSKISAEQAVTTSNLEVFIDSGEGNLNQNTQAINSWYNGLPEELKVKYVEKRTSMLKSANTQNDNKNKQSEIFLDIDAAIEGRAYSGIFDQNDVNQHFTELSNTLSTDPIERSQQIGNYVGSVRYVPKQVSSQIRNNILSGDEDKIIIALDTMDRITEYTGLENAFDSSEFALANRIQSNLLYMPREQAIKTAVEQTSKDNLPLITRRQDTFDAALKNKNKPLNETLDADIASQYSSWFGLKFKPDTQSGAQIMNDYAELVEAYYLSGNGSSEGFDKAREMAQKTIQTQWQSSGISPSGVMKYAPSKFYIKSNGLPVSTEEMQSEIFNAGMLNNQNSLNYTQENIYLLSDSETERLSSYGMPNYKAYVVDNDGVIQQLTFVDNEGISADRYFPDVAAAMEIENARIKEKANRAVLQQDVGLLSEYPSGNLTGRFPEGSEIIDIGEGLIGPNPVDVIKAAQLTGPSYVPSSKIGKVSNLEQSLPASDLIKNVSKFNKQFIKNLKKGSTKRKDK